MEVVFVLKTPTKPAAECILCAPLARNRVAAEAGQGREEPTKIGGGPAREGGAGGMGPMRGGLCAWGAYGLYCIRSSSVFVPIY